jgi:hypothetical protein
MIKIYDIIKKNQIYIILFIIILLIIIFIRTGFITYEYLALIKNDGSDKKIIIRKNCLYNQSSTLNDIINETISNFKFNLHIPCLYDNLEFEYDEFKYDPNGIYFLIDNSDIMVSKSMLAKEIKNEYLADTENLIPKTWVVENNEETNKLIEEFNPDRLYILKKNIQRQTDIKISRNLKEITNLINTNKDNNFPYVVVQELLQNPYLIDGRKINLRVYVLLVKFDDEYRIYVYGDGFMYYTAERYKPDSDDIKSNITTGYIDRKVYEKNPLTLKDLKLYLDSESRPLTNTEIKIKRYNLLSQYLFDNINNLIKDIFYIFRNKIGITEKLKQNKKFQLYGVDIAVNDDLNVKLMEINKGPDLDAKDKRDSELKHNLVRDTFKTVNLIDNDSKNDFVRIFY